MKQKVVTSLIALSMAALAMPASAQEVRTSVRASTTPEKVRLDVRAKIDQRRASTTERREERRENIAERKASSTERRIEIQQDVARRKAEHTAKVLLAAVERLGNLALRLESRIAKLQANNVDTAEAEAYVAEAKGYLSEARISLNTFASIDLSGEKAKENFERIRSAASAVKEDIRAAHTALKDAAKLLKAMSPRPVPAATSTSANTSSSQ